MVEPFHQPGRHHGLYSHLGGCVVAVVAATPCRLVEGWLRSVLVGHRDLTVGEAIIRLLSQTQTQKKKKKKKKKKPSTASQRDH